MQQPKSILKFHSISCDLIVAYLSVFSRAYGFILFFGITQFGFSRSPANSSSLASPPGLPVNQVLAAPLLFAWFSVFGMRFDVISLRFSSFLLILRVVGSHTFWHVSLLLYFRLLLVPRISLHKLPVHPLVFILYTWVILIRHLSIFNTLSAFCYLFGLCFSASAFPIANIVISFWLNVSAASDF